MKSSFKRGVSLAISIPLIFGIASCSAEEAPAEEVQETQDVRDNLSHLNENGQFRDGVSTKNILLPKEMQESTPVWDYNFEEHGIGESQVLHTNDRVVIVDRGTFTGNYRIVVINSETGQTLADEQVFAYGDYSPAYIVEKDGKEYLNIVQMTEEISSDPLQKGGEKIVATWVDLDAEDPKVNTGSSPVGVKGSSSVENDSRNGSDFHGFPYVKAQTTADKYKIFFAVGDEVRVNEERPYGLKILGFSEGKPVFLNNSIENAFMSFASQTDGKDVNLMKITDNRSLTDLYWSDDKYMMVGDNMMQTIYLVDTDAQKVVVERKHPNTVADATDLATITQYDLSDNGKYAVFSTFLIDIDKKKLIDMSETDTTQRVSFTHVNDEGIAYGEALDNSVLVEYDIKTGEQVSSQLADDQKFGKVLETLDDGSILVETEEDILVVKKNEPAQESQPAEPAPSE